MDATPKNFQMGLGKNILGDTNISNQIMLFATCGTNGYFSFKDKNGNYYQVPNGKTLVVSHLVWSKSQGAGTSRFQYLGHGTAFSNGGAPAGATFTFPAGGGYELGYSTSIGTQYAIPILGNHCNFPQNVYPFILSGTAGEGISCWIYGEEV